MENEQKLLEAVITIQETSDSGDKIKIKDTTNKTWNIWKFKKGTDTKTVAYTNFLSLPETFPKQAKVKYKTFDGTTKDGSPYTSKSIMWLEHLKPGTLEVTGKIVSSDKTNEPTDTNTIWEAKDRTSAMQTAVQSASRVFEGTKENIEKVTTYAKGLYQLIIRARNGDIKVDEPNKKGDDINVEDIPF